MTSRLLAAAALTVLTLGSPAVAQEVTLSLGENGASLSGRAVQVFVLITVLSLVPGIAITVTCFPFLITVLSILRQGIGLQQSPPNMLIVSLALFLTWFVMDPVFQAAWNNGIAPVVREEQAIEAALPEIIEPFRVFMLQRVDPETLASIADLRPESAGGQTTETPLSILVPSFLLSEMSRAFQIGFLVFLPFLIIDLVVAAILMSMGMMMVPPVIVSLPFKLAFFVVADGWSLIAGSLVRSYF